MALKKENFEYKKNLHIILLLGYMSKKKPKIDLNIESYLRLIGLSSKN